MANPYASATADGSATIRLGYAALAGALKAAPVLPSLPLRAAFRAIGTAADQVDGWAWATLAMAASTPQVVDLSAMVDLQGNPLTAARARLIAIRWGCQADAVPLLVGGAGTNEFDGFLSGGGKIAVPPSSPGNDGWLVIAAPQTSGMPIDATHRLLKLDPQAGAGQVDLVVAACSA